jgi:hypothetical protein
VTRDRAQIRHAAALETLPDGVFVLAEGQTCLVLGDALRPFAPGGYGAPKRRGEGRVTVLTPAPTVAALAAGYRPVLHPSATGAGAAALTAR